MEIKYFDEINKDVLKVWYSMPSKYDKYKKRYSKKKDADLHRLNKKLKAGLKRLDINKLDDEIADALVDEVQTFAVRTIGMSQSAVDEIFKKDYFEHSKTFIERARQVEPEIDREGIFQALRNVWVMHSMQMYLGQEVEITDSVFAYSMLYPLTDNYLDDPGISKADKMDFNMRFREKIKSGHGQGRNEAECKCFEMIDLIEKDWNRFDHPRVFEGLLAILDGQNASLHQHGMKSLFDKDLLSLTFYKGGSSVLADAYLVKGVLSREEELFAYMYGVILQLADDLQDLEVDLKEEHFTIMNIQGTLGHLDTILHKMLNLIDHFIDNHYEQNTKAQVALRELTHESIQLLIFEALMRSKSYISKAVYKRISEGSHFSTRAYKKVEKSFNKQLNTIVASL
ncbi:hypothetical protein EZV73_13735 [Acidaminobacter sp. JC074]|uniref:hypothetical protein n=1 Tax=Acidaminobacter sp. JC074 TaxID=2530199 RepID=UPI001F0D7432|nr:hypothetical protein [Acidaminobacter sp. JC074]MCH4888649.1 hypothetical protein [Acidaminobacter sp. JC074]